MCCDYYILGACLFSNERQGVDLYWRGSKDEL